MADPDHVPEMDGFDRLTVALYRVGIAVSAVGLGLLAAAEGGWAVPVWFARAVVLAGTALSIADLHLYDKRIRWVIGASGWTGAALLFVGASWAGSAATIVVHAGLGFLFVSLSAIALKERFCFRVPGLRAVPVMLALSLIPQLMNVGAASAGLLGVAAVVYGVLAVVKWRMPLHFDIGNKAAYQV